ncbi:hypothetical protein PQX77_020220 [Marasmius sp. AFHP31]|nr:hypothetical protein PQX77_020220 [Marasmius sp. AFHP31]
MVARAEDLVNEYWERVNSAAGRQPENSRGHTALQEMFDNSEELLHDIQHVQELCESSNATMQSAGNVSGIAGTLSTSFPAYNTFISHLIVSARALVEVLSRRGMTYKKLGDSPQASLLTVTFPTEALSPFLPDTANPLFLVLPKYNVCGQVTFDKWLEKPLLEFVLEHFLLNRTKSIATFKYTNTPAHIRGKDEWVVWGALAEALVDVSDDDSVLGLEAVHTAFNHPKAFFNRPGECAALTVANDIIADPEKSTTDLQRLTSVSVKGGQRSAARQKKAKQVDFIGTPVDPETPLAQLIPYKERPNFAFLLAMLREVLAFARTDKCCIDYLHRILTCCDLKTGTEKQSLNPDHYSPIRCSTYF